MPDPRSGSSSDGRGDELLDDLPPGALLIAVALGGVVAVGLVPALIAIVVLAAARALGLRRRHLLLAAVSALGVLVLIGVHPASARFAHEAPVWRLGGALRAHGLTGVMWDVAPVAVSLGFVLAVAGELWIDFRRPFWVERREPVGLAQRLGDRRERRRLAAGAIEREHGVALGVNAHRRVVELSGGELGEHALLLGATGSGKTTTLLQIVRGVLPTGGGLVLVDLKGEPGLAASLGALAARHAREFELWSFDGPSQFDPLARGDATELTDKLVGLEEWSEPHYKRAAQRYLHHLLHVLIEADEPRTLSAVTELLEPKRLAKLITDLEGERLPPELALRVGRYLKGLDDGAQSAARGLANRLALLSETRAGSFLTGGPDVIDLARSLAEGRVTVFSLDSQKYGETAAQMATLVAQDLKTVAAQRQAQIGRGAPPPPAYVVFDEFSAVRADHLHAMFERARSARVGVVLSTQELADLGRIDPGFTDQVLGNTNVKVIHRQDVPESAERLAGLAGTRSIFEETWQTDRDPFQSIAGRRFGGRRGQNTGQGTIREVEQYVVHPNELKSLARGEAVLIVKSPRIRVERIHVTVPRDAHAATARLDEPLRRAEVAQAPVREGAA